MYLSFMEKWNIFSSIAIKIEENNPMVSNKNNRKYVIQKRELFLIVLFVRIFLLTSLFTSTIYFVVLQLKVKKIIQWKSK